jgi:hypothetical protein
MQTASITCHAHFTIRHAVNVNMKISKLMKKLQFELLRKTGLVMLAVALRITSLSTYGQDDIHSADLTKAWKAIVENMGAAQASDQAAFTKATDFLASAKVSKNRANDTNLSPEVRFENHAACLDAQAKAARVKLDAARQNTKFLAAADAALAQIQKDMGNLTVPTGPDWSSPESQKGVDVPMGDYKFAEGDDISADNAQELRDTRAFYKAISDGSAKGLDGAALYRRVAGKLRVWQARNRQQLVSADSALGRMELAAVSGLAGVINYGIDQGNTNLWTLGFSADLAPDVSTGNAATVSSPTWDKVSLSDVLGGR